MGLELAKAFIRVSVDSRRILPQLSGIRKLVTSGLGGAASGITGMMGRTMATVGSVITRSITSAVTGAISAVTKLSAVVGGLAVAGGGILIGRGLKLAADLESTTIAFETMLGSTDKAKKVLDDLQKFAESTPFQLPGIQKASKILLSFGVSAEDLMPTLRNLGDLSAGTGKDFGELAVIFGQIKAKGKLMGGEMMQLAEAGINLRPALAESFGVAESEVSELVEKGKVGFAEVQAAMGSLTDEGGQFHNLMAKQSKSLGGLVSTLKDRFDGLLRTIGTALIPAARDLTNTLLDFIQRHQGAITGMAERIAAFAQNAIDWFRVLLSNSDVVWQLIKAQAVLSLSKMKDFFANVWENMPIIAGAALNAMVVGFKKWVVFTINTLKRLGRAFMIVIRTIRDSWAAMWNGDTVWGVYKRGLNEMGDLMKEHMHEIADIGKEMGKTFKDQTVGLDLFAESDVTKRLMAERNKLTGILASAKTQLDQKRQADATKKVGEEIGKSAGIEVAKSIGTKPFDKSGLFGIADIGRKVQESFFKSADDKQSKMVSLLEAGNKKQDDLIQAVKDTNVRPGPAVAG